MTSAKTVFPRRDLGLLGIEATNFLEMASRSSRSGLDQHSTLNRSRAPVVPEQINYPAKFAISGIAEHNAIVDRNIRSRVITRLTFGKLPPSRITRAFIDDLLITN